MQRFIRIRRRILNHIRMSAFLLPVSITGIPGHFVQNPQPISRGNFNIQKSFYYIVIPNFIDMFFQVIPQLFSGLLRGFFRKTGKRENHNGQIPGKFFTGRLQLYFIRLHFNAITFFYSFYDFGSQ